MFESDFDLIFCPRIFQKYAVNFRKKILLIIVNHIPTALCLFVSIIYNKGTQQNSCGQRNFVFYFFVCIFGYGLNDYTLS